MKSVKHTRYKSNLKLLCFEFETVIHGRYLIIYWTLNYFKETADLVTFTEESRKGKPHFLFSVRCIRDTS